MAAAKKLLDKLLAAPTKVDAKAADVQGYVNIVLTIAKRVMETDKENAESLFLSVWNTLHPFLMKRETETLKVVAPIVAEFLNASKSTLEDFSEATMKQLVDDCTSLLVAAKEGGSFGYFEVFRAVIQVVGSKNPELLMPLAKEMNNQLKRSRSGWELTRSNKKMRVLVTDLFNVIPLPLFMSVITIVDVHMLASPELLEGQRPQRPIPPSDALSRHERCQQAVAAGALLQRVPSHLKSNHEEVRGAQCGREGA